MSLAAWLTYAVNNCTRFVAQTFSWIPAGLGDAHSWLANAGKYGLQTTSAPTVGSVAVMTRVGEFGHVGVVQAVKGDLVTLHDQNWDLHGGVLTHDVKASSIAGYILAPGMAAASAVSSGGLPSLPGLPSLGLGDAIAGIPASVGHGLANALAAGVVNAETFFSNQAIALVVAAVVVLVIFLA